MAPFGRDNSLTIRSPGRAHRRTARDAAQWKSRYGLPRPIRLTGGHRRYATDEQLA